MRLLAIDPGTTESAWVVWDGGRILEHGKVPNQMMMDALHHIKHGHGITECAIEMVASFGMPVGAEVFETVYWIGRFAQAFGASRVTRLTRNAIKNHLCHSSRAKDANIRQAIIDRLGPVGTKKAPGACYGVSGDVWSAIAVALTWWDTHQSVANGGQLALGIERGELRMKTPAQLSEGRRERLEHMAVKSAQQQGEIAVLTAENERLRQELTEARDIAEDFMRKDLDSSLVARQENERLRSALAIYAYHGNWNSTREGWFDEWMESGSDGFTYDGTAIARAALEAK